MQDPLITIRGFLNTNWGLAGDLLKANVNFSTGWYDKTIDQPQVTVTLVSNVDQPFELGYGVVRINAIYQIDAWVIIQHSSNKSPGNAKANIWSMQEEINRILKSQLKPGNGITLLIMRELGVRLDEDDAAPPILRWSKRVAVIYDI